MSLPLASLSLDLDDKWAYLRTHGAAEWEEYPTYLPEVVPRIVDFLGERDLRLTAFVVGRDAERASARRPLEALVDAGHEIGNHSYNHYPWLKTLPLGEIEREVREAETPLEDLAGRRCAGFRAPGFSSSPELHRILAERGYAYDASSLPTFLGPLARAYCAVTSMRRSRKPAADGSTDGPTHQKDLFGSWRDGLAPLTAHEVRAGDDRLVEVPVTSMPVLRLPFHMTYLLYLRQTAGPVWRPYLRTALALCRLRGVRPSMLLHPLDFLGAEDEPELSFFPGMKLPRAEKLAVVVGTLDALASAYRLAPLAETAAACVAGPRDVACASDAAEDLAPEPAVV